MAAAETNLSAIVNVTTGSPTFNIPLGTTNLNVIKYLYLNLSAASTVFVGLSNDGNTIENADVIYANATAATTSFVCINPPTTVFVIPPNYQYIVVDFPSLGSDITVNWAMSYLTFPVSIPAIDSRFNYLSFALPSSSSTDLIIGNSSTLIVQSIICSRYYASSSTLVQLLLNGTMYADPVSVSNTDLQSTSILTAPLYLKPTDILQVAFPDSPTDETDINIHFSTNT